VHPEGFNLAGCLIHELNVRRFPVQRWRNSVGKAVAGSALRKRNAQRAADRILGNTFEDMTEMTEDMGMPYAAASSMSHQCNSIATHVEAA